MRNSRLPFDGSFRDPLRATRSGPVTPTPACSEPSAGPDIQVFPQGIDAASSHRPPVSAMLAPPSEADDASSWGIVEEWGVQSFPASDPPANW